MIRGFSWSPDGTKLASGGGGGTIPIYSNVSIPLNQWSHIGIIVESDSAYLYLNGELTATIPVSSASEVLFASSIEAVHT